jgi:3-phenylpropionate/cinnamic acid dioxygenase small subunit
MDIHELSDRAEITQLLYTYARGIDSKDWGLWRSVFLEDAHLDYSSANGPVGDRESIAQWLEGSFAYIEGAHHHLTNIEITVDGDDAEAIALFWNPFRAQWTQQFSAAGGYYRHKLVRTPAGWKSRELVEDNRWIQDAPGMPPGH